MKSNFTRYFSFIIIFMLLFANIASALNQLESTNNLSKFNNKNTASITGSVVTAEAGLPLVTGTASVNGQKITVENGHFQLENLSPGLHKITIKGPFRKQHEKNIVLQAGENHVNILVDTVLSEEEIQMLAKITRAEAEGENEQGRIAVAATVLNRVLSSKYPNTVQQVVYQRISGRYQYSPVYDGRINVTPRAQDYNAAYLALAGNDPTYGATGFYNPTKTRDKWVRSHPVTTQIGGHTFFIY